MIHDVRSYREPDNISKQITGGPASCQGDSCMRLAVSTQLNVAASGMHTCCTCFILLAPRNSQASSMIIASFEWSMSCCWYCSPSSNYLGELWQSYMATPHRPFAGAFQSSKPIYSSILSTGNSPINFHFPSSQGWEMKQE